MWAPGASTHNLDPSKCGFPGLVRPSSVDLKQPNATTAEENVAGNGTLGQFTFRDVRATAASPGPSSTCTGIFFPSTLGGGVFRFQDGSLLTVTLLHGGDCLD